jgi:hypothetical protein
VWLTGAYYSTGAAQFLWFTQTTDFESLYIFVLLAGNNELGVMQLIGRACGRAVLYFYCVQFFRAQRGKTAHSKISKYLAAAGKCGFEMRNSATA